MLLMFRQLHPAQDLPLLEVILDPSLPQRESHHDDDEVDEDEEDDDEEEEVDIGMVKGNTRLVNNHVLIQARLALKLYHDDAAVHDEDEDDVDDNAAG